MKSEDSKEAPLPGRGSNALHGFGNLPMNALSEIPTPKPDAPWVTALKKDKGRITGYQLSDGQILEKDAAIALAKSGGIAGVGISTNSGNEYLKSLPDNLESNNLSHLPTVSEEKGD